MGKIHPHSNKWLLYSTTLITSFIILSNCGSVGGADSSNDIGGNTRHVNRIPGKSHNHDNNEVNSRPFRGPEKFGDEHEEDDEDEENYDDDESYYDSGNSEELDPADVHYIDQYEKEHPPPPKIKPQMAKCCPYGEAINADYRCKPLKSHHHKEWFPKQVFDGRNFTATNISEWDIQTDSNSFVCGQNESSEILSDWNTFAILTDGQLYLLKHKKIVPPLQFCVDHQLGKGEGHVVKTCFSREELCGGSSFNCLRKCCPDASFVDETSSRCSTQTNLSQRYNFNNPNWSVVHERPSCQHGHSLLPINGTFSINKENGSLITSDFTVPFLQYCLDHFINLKSHEKEEEYEGEEEPVVKVMMCFDEAPEQDDPHGLHIVSTAFATVIGISLVLSATSIAIAALVSWRLPELHSLHGKCQISHLATLFSLFICLAIVQLGRERIPTGLCKFFAVFIHTCALSSFLWLNLLCFNIYMTFRSLRPPLAARRDENRRLFFLFIYAWGIPASFVAFLFVLDSQPGRLEPMPRPQYGVLKCLMSSRDAEFAYLFGPVGVLLLINGLLFCLTAQELLCGLWRLDNSDSITFRRKSMGLVVAKLGIVMGMGWILDVFSWGFGKKFPFVFYAGDVFNALQGVFICIVLLWRKRVLEVLHLRKPSITKDETLTVRPFLPKNGVNNASSHLDNDTSLVIVQDQ